MVERQLFGHPSGKPVILKLGPDWDGPDGVDIPAAIALWSPALGCLLQKLSRITSSYWPMPFFLTDRDGPPDFGDIPEYLKQSIEVWWDWYEEDEEQCYCPDMQCLYPSERQCRSTRMLERPDRIELLAYDLFDEMIAEGHDYRLKYLPANDPSADWQSFSSSRLRMLNRCDIDLRRSTVKLGGSNVRVRVFRTSVHKVEARPINKERKTSRGGRPPKYDWEGFLIEVLRKVVVDYGSELPDRLELHRYMVEWCAENWPEQPEESEIRKRLARIYETPGILP